MKAISRQRRWQLAHQAKGNCVQCGNPSQGRALCDACAKHGRHVKYRKPLKSEWAAVNWDDSNIIIAADLGVTVNAVCWQRRKAKR